MKTFIALLFTAFAFVAFAQAGQPGVAGKQYFLGLSDAGTLPARPMIGGLVYDTIRQHVQVTDGGVWDEQLQRGDLLSCSGSANALGYSTSTNAFACNNAIRASDLSCTACVALDYLQAAVQASLPKAAAFIDGRTAQCPATVCVVADAKNVTSATRDSAGRYTIVLTSGIDDSTYNVQVTDLSGDKAHRVQITNGTTFGIQCDDLAGIPTDCIFMFVVWDFQ